MERTLPPRVAQYLQMAEREGLSDPLGRALYTHNRKVNSHRGKPEEILRSAKPETAERWRLHWEAGGSLKALTRNVEQERIFQQERRDRFLSEGDRLRRAVRSVRRAVKRGEIVVPQQMEGW